MRALAALALAAAVAVPAVPTAAAPARWSARSAGPSPASAEPVGGAALDRS